jgi:hypothetical protein
MTYRNRRLLNLAHKVQECQFQLRKYGCMGISLRGCEPCHSNQGKHGKGTGHKAADDQHVAGCPVCHRVYDGQAGIVIPREEAVEAFDAGRERTFKLYDKNGWLEKVGYIEGATV